MIHPSNDAPQPRGEPDHAALKAKLQQLEETSRRSTNAFSLKSYVRQHYNDLKEAHRKGHTWSALAQIICAELQVEMAPETLRKYMAAIRQELELEGTTVESTPHPSSPKRKSAQQRDIPLAKNLQPSAEREFRRSHRRPHS